METFSKFVWILVTILCAVSIVWFLFGTTANFQRSIDLVTTIIFVYLWFPALILVVISTTLLLKGWTPYNKLHYIILWIMILLVIYLSVYLFKGVNTQGWLNDSIRSDPIKITSDGKYEYRFELVNLFQKNSRGQLYLKDISTGKEMYISVNVDSHEIHGIRVLRGDDWAWAMMYPSNMLDHYELITTDNLPVPEKRFLIDIKEGTAKIMD